MAIRPIGNSTPLDEVAWSSSFFGVLGALGGLSILLATACQVISRLYEVARYTLSLQFKQPLRREEKRGYGMTFFHVRSQQKGERNAATLAPPFSLGFPASRGTPPLSEGGTSRNCKLRSFLHRFSRRIPAPRPMKIIVRRPCFSYDAIRARASRRTECSDEFSTT